MANAMNCVNISNGKGEQWPIEKHDFSAFGKAVKAARMPRKESHKVVSKDLFISPRYLAENKGEQPSLQIFYELITRYDISTDQFFFPNKDDMYCKSLKRVNLLFYDILIHIHDLLHKTTHMNCSKTLKIQDLG